MLIAEIIGTIVVWRRGWGPYALLPIIGALIGGAVIADIAGGATGATFLADIGCVVALVAMYYSEPDRSKQVATPARPATIPPAPTGESDTRQAA